MEIIKVRGLTKRYKDVTAVENLDLTVRQGDIYGFLGRNGAGKTTTIRMILDLIQPDHGTIELFGGMEISKNRNILRDIGNIVETPGFYLPLTASENLDIHAKLMKLKDNTAIDRALDTVGLRAVANKRVQEFSMGMKQRLGIARALLSSPKLLVLDEPINGLDPGGIKEVRQLLRRLALEEELTIFVSSHILGEVEQLATRVGIIHEGRLQLEETMDKLQQRKRRVLLVQAEPQTLFLQHLERLGCQFSLSERGVEITHTILTPAKLNQQLVKAGLDVSHLSTEQQSLEELFLELTAS